MRRLGQFLLVPVLLLVVNTLFGFESMVLAGLSVIVNLLLLTDYE